MSFDVAYEHKWKPILPVLERPNEDLKDPDDKFKYQYDTREAERDLFEKFQDQGEEMRKMELDELNENEAFWKEEKFN